MSHSSNITNLCDCMYPGCYKCGPRVSSTCIQSFDCSNNIGCSSFDNVAIERNIQNQSRMPASQFTDALQDVTVAQGILSFKGSPPDFASMSSSVWGSPNYLRNQSDRSTPSRSGEWKAPGTINRNPAFGVSVNVPSRGNSTKTTITGNRPGAMTPGGEGVDVKHGSYNRYLSKKKGAILTKSKVTITQTPPTPLIWYRQGSRESQTVYDSAGMNNMSYKFTPISLNDNCKDTFKC